MKKKLQVFISSTYEDLKEERQVAVESVLNAGHIPAGMELFKSDDKSQKEIIKRWIDESDVYMLILGGRYGSIDKETGLSYTHWEYNYAGEVGKPRFAVVIDGAALEEKVRMIGSSVIERNDPALYEEFKGEVLSKICKFYSDLKDIKITVLESLKEYESNPELYGWVSGREVRSIEKLEQIDVLESKYATLLEQHNKLLQDNAKLQGQKRTDRAIDGLPFVEVKSLLEDIEIVIPKETEGINLKKDWQTNVHTLFIVFREYLAVGIQNKRGMSKIDNIVFFKVAPYLMQYGLVEKLKQTGTPVLRMQTTKDGMRYLKFVDLEKREKEDLQDEVAIKSEHN
ncbi:DUF4062 domain-containing protein [Sporosarcina obsidiansis]|uniref:DUF4062 domain-containing protein n=1 Tax=Sporosarcina obsidiansis TaxID=2660748 RepID=UPI00129AB305|nr:DUF4062 domain-containing protein [Sporosarcina obsidiansis]